MRRGTPSFVPVALVLNRCRRGIGRIQRLASRTMIADRGLVKRSKITYFSHKMIPVDTHVYFVLYSAVMAFCRKCSNGRKSKLTKHVIQGDHSGCAKPPVDIKTVYVLVHGSHAKMELLFLSQREVWHNLNGHPVYMC